MTLAKSLVLGSQHIYDTVPTGLAPDKVHVAKGKVEMALDRAFRLRPEHIESLFLLYRLTGDSKYQDMGWKIFQNLEAHCKTDLGYGGLSNVWSVEGKNNDDMPSYFIAETLKYLLLLFAPDDYVSVEDFVFTTEAHPLRKVSNPQEVILPNGSDFTVPVPFPWLLGVLVLLLTTLFVAILILGTRLTRLLRGQKRSRIEKSS
mmetsp:Transcript_23782/g.44187  ORF Transcript_23782/g.44187 Transcript_23782/m.44187 type:complete len:203 (+) Transcript_23782:388-996(+)